jgi:hypothetical protein
MGYQFTDLNQAGTSADVSAGIAVSHRGSNFTAGTLGVGISSQEGADFNLTEERGGYFEAYEAVNTTVTTRRGLLAFAGNATTNTTATNEGIVVQTGAKNGTNTNDYSLHILSPNLSIGGTGGTLTNHVGLQIEDQTVVGNGTNSNPVAIQTVGGAPSKFNGLISPPIAALASLPSCGAATEGGHAVATNCTGCSAGSACTTGGSTHCEMYCNGSSYVQTGR